MDCLEAIFSRRSIRRFKPQDVEEDIIKKVIEAGCWAPSGKNNQPWRFIVVENREIREKLAELTISGRIIREAPVAIAVFLDTSVSYHREKDIQSIGACIQNMLLAIHAMGLGGVWLGEILKNKDKVSQILNAKPEWDLMAVICFGHSAAEGKSSRQPLESVIGHWFK